MILCTWSIIFQKENIGYGDSRYFVISARWHWDIFLSFLQLFRYLTLHIFYDSKSFNLIDENCKNFILLSENIWKSIHVECWIWHFQEKFYCKGEYVEYLKMLRLSFVFQPLVECGIFTWKYNGKLWQNYWIWWFRMVQISQHRQQKWNAEVFHSRNSIEQCCKVLRYLWKTWTIQSLQYFVCKISKITKVTSICMTNLMSRSSIWHIIRVLCSNKIMKTLQKFILEWIQSCPLQPIRASCAKTSMQRNENVIQWNLRTRVLKQQKSQQMKFSIPCCPLEHITSNSRLEIKSKSIKMSSEESWVLGGSFILRPFYDAIKYTWRGDEEKRSKSEESFISWIAQLK